VTDSFLVAPFAASNVSTPVVRRPSVNRIDGAVSDGTPPEFLSTHPLEPTRMRDIQNKLAQVVGLHAREPRPDRSFEPPLTAADRQRRPAMTPLRAAALQGAKRTPRVISCYRANLSIRIRMTAR